MSGELTNVLLVKRHILLRQCKAHPANSSEFLSLPQHHVLKDSTRMIFEELAT